MEWVEGLLEESWVKEVLEDANKQTKKSGKKKRRETTYMNNNNNSKKKKKTDKQIHRERK